MELRALEYVVPVVGLPYPMRPDEAGAAWAVKCGFAVSVRYDNGQLCTFRRKPHAHA